MVDLLLIPQLQLKNSVIKSCCLAKAGKGTKF